MTGAKEFAVVADVLQHHFSDDTDVFGIEITLDGGCRTVRVQTENANRFLGHGAALNMAREALAEQFDDPGLQLHIEEIPPWSAGSPPDHPAGDREPRPWAPASPSGAVAKDIPHGR